MAFPHIIPWYSLYSSAVDAVWLTAVILRHPAAFAAASADVAAVLRDEEQRELLRFEAVVVDDDDDDDSVSNDGTVNSSAPIADHLTSGARRVFGVPSLRPRQDEAIHERRRLLPTGLLHAGPVVVGASRFRGGDAGQCGDRIALRTAE